MAFKTFNITIPTQGVNLYPMADVLQELIDSTGFKEGVLTLFCKHSNCSLLIMDKSSPSILNDIVNYLNRLVPKTIQGLTYKPDNPDEILSHIKTALTCTSETIPFFDSKLCLDQWQGVFLWEHRNEHIKRNVVISIQGF